MLLPILNIYLKNSRASGWLKPSAFVMSQGAKLEHEYNDKQRARCQNFVCLAFERCLFHVFYY